MNRAVVTALAGVVVLLFIWFARHVLLIVFGGVLFATFLVRLARRIASLTRLPRGWSLGLTVVGLLSLFVAVFYLRGSQIADQAVQLADQLPRALRSMEQRLSGEQWAQWLMERIPREQIISQASSAWPQITGAVSGFFGAIVSMLLVVYFALALAATPRVYRRGLVQLAPRERREGAAALLGRMGDTLLRRRWSRSPWCSCESCTWRRNSPTISGAGGRRPHLLRLQAPELGARSPR